MNLTWVIAGIVCGWAVLRVIGSERERRVRELSYKIAAASEAAQPAKSAKNSEGERHAVRSKVSR